MHVAIDDASRLAYTELLPNERKESATAFLIRALGWFERHGVTVARVMTDNGSCDRSKLVRETCAAAEARHLRTKPYAARNQRAERFIQTSLREWAYAAAYHTSTERAAAMPIWLCGYRASEHPSGYVIDVKRFCWAVRSRGGSRVLAPRSAMDLAASVARAARAKSQGPSGKGWLASISPASAASRIVLGVTFRSRAASPRLSQGSRPFSAGLKTGTRWCRLRT